MDQYGFWQKVTIDKSRQRWIFHQRVGRSSIVSRIINTTGPSPKSHRRKRNPTMRIQNMLSYSKLMVRAIPGANSQLLTWEQLGTNLHDSRDNLPTKNTANHIQFVPIQVQRDQPSTIWTQNSRSLHITVVLIVTSSCMALTSSEHFLNYFHGKHKLVHS